MSDKSVLTALGGTDEVPGDGTNPHVEGTEP